MMRVCLVPSLAELQRLHLQVCKQREGADAGGRHTWIRLHAHTTVNIQQVTPTH